MPKDEFEDLLDRCRQDLSEITLRIPTLENSAPRPAVYSLTPPLAAAPKPAVPPKPAAPPKPAPAAVKPPPALMPQTPPAFPPQAVVPPQPVAPPQAVIAPQPAFVPPPQAFEPPKPAPTPPPPAPQAVMPPVPTEHDEVDVFPPLRMRAKTPPPSTTLWSAQTDSVKVAAPAEAPTAGGSRRTATTATAAAAVIAIGTFGAWLARRPSPDIDIELDGADAMASRPEKGDLLVAEGKELVDLSLDGRVLERRPFDDAPVESLRWEQGSLWSANGRTASVIEHSEGGPTTVFRLNHVPSAVFVKDNYIWTAAKGENLIHQFLISRSILGAILQPIDSFDLNGLTPETFTIDDSGTLWLVDESTRRLHRLRLENGSYKRVASAPLSPFFGPQGTLRSLSVESNGVWVLSQPAGGHASLRRIALSRLDWTQ